jgi:hypothetical protein
MRTTAITILCVAAILFCLTELVSVAAWSFRRSFVGIIEYPERLLIALCLASATALLSAFAIRAERSYSRWLRLLASWLSVIIGLGALLTKSAVAMISADSDIHQRHLICVWCGGLLLALAATQRTERPR